MNIIFYISNNFFGENYDMFRRAVMFECIFQTHFSVDLKVFMLRSTVAISIFQSWKMFIVCFLDISKNLTLFNFLFHLINFLRYFKSKITLEYASSVTFSSPKLISTEDLNTDNLLVVESFDSIHMLHRLSKRIEIKP